MAARTRLHRRHQPPVRGGRDPLPSCVVGSLYHRVDEDARRNNVSRSWVVAAILGDHYGIDVPSYRTKSLGRSNGK